MPEPDDKVLFHALRTANVAEDLAYTAVQEVRNMAGQNVIAAIGANQAVMEARFAELKAELSILRWIIGIGFAAVAAAAIARLFS